MAGNIIVIGILLVVVGFALHSIIRSKKAGGCAGCSNAANCGHAKQSKCNANLNKR